MKNEIITSLIILAFSISFVLNIIFYQLFKINKMWSAKFRDAFTKEVAKGTVDAEPLIKLLWGNSDS